MSVFVISTAFFCSAQKSSASFSMAEWAPVGAPKPTLKLVFEIIYLSPPVFIIPDDAHPAMDAMKMDRNNILDEDIVLISRVLKISC